MLFFIHHVYHALDNRRVVGSIAVNLYIEDVAATGQGRGMEPRSVPSSGLYTYSIQARG